MLMYFMHITTTQSLTILSKASFCLFKTCYVITAVISTWTSKQDIIDANVVVQSRANLTPADLWSQIFQQWPFWYYFWPTVSRTTLFNVSILVNSPVEFQKDLDDISRRLKLRMMKIVIYSFITIIFKQSHFFYTCFIRFHISIISGSSYIFISVQTIHYWSLFMFYGKIIPY